MFVGNGKGYSRANFTKVNKDAHGKTSPAYDYIGTCFNGSVALIDEPRSLKWSRTTQRVRRNSPYKPDYLRQAPIESHCVIPDRLGGSCPIKYVLYIIKENRTYDQIYGDFKDASGQHAGNGDPRLAMYGEPVTTNQHQIARDYVLLDNLYCNGEVSVDGHSWCDAAMATDYNERSWIISYSSHGDLPGNDELMVPAGGCLWDLCRRNGLSYRNYGEGSDRVPTSDRGKWGHGGYWTVRDMDKVDSWIQDLHDAEKTGVLPRFTIMSLGENHTPREPSPAHSRRMRTWPAMTSAWGRSWPPPAAASSGRKWRSHYRGRCPERPGPRRRAPHRRTGH